MSKYDDKKFQSYYEKIEQKLPRTQGGDIKEFPAEFKNMSTSDIKKLMYLNKDEELNFNFFNNKQEYITDDYCKNLKKFDNKMSKDEKLNYILDFMKEAYGVLTPALLKKCFEDSYGIWDPSLTLQDYEDMIQDNFGKKQIDLNNPDDKEKFKSVLINAENISIQNDKIIQENEQQQQQQQQLQEQQQQIKQQQQEEDLNAFLPAANKGSIHIKESEVPVKRQGERQLVEEY